MKREDGVGIWATRKDVESFFTQFKCRRCGKCCEGEEAPDGIFLLKTDLVNLSEYLGISVHKFKEIYTFIGNKGERFLPYPCPFYSKEGHSCTIYYYRPAVCKMYPLTMNIGLRDKLILSELCPISYSIAEAYRLITL